MSEETLNTALMAPKQEVYLETGKKNVMSVDIPVLNTKQEHRTPTISIPMVLLLPPVIWTER